MDAAWFRGGAAMLLLAYSVPALQAMAAGLLVVAPGLADSIPGGVVGVQVEDLRPSEEAQGVAACWEVKGESSRLSQAWPIATDHVLFCTQIGRPAQGAIELRSAGQALIVQGHGEPVRIVTLVPAGYRVPLLIETTGAPVSGYLNAEGRVLMNGTLAPWTITDYSRGLFITSGIGAILFVAAIAAAILLRRKWAGILLVGSWVLAPFLAREYLVHVPFGAVVLATFLVFALRWAKPGAEGNADVSDSQLTNPAPEPGKP